MYGIDVWLFRQSSGSNKWIFGLTSQLELENAMQKLNVQGFVRVLVASNYREGKSFAIQSSGLGALEPNTLLLGWPNEWHQEGHYHNAEVSTSCPRILRTPSSSKVTEFAFVVVASSCHSLFVHISLILPVAFLPLCFHSRIILSLLRCLSNAPWKIVASEILEK